jgi:Protein of unknown function (DUF2914)/Tetratricopeptide repeat
MAEERNAQHLIEQAERAAIAGDLAAADDLLRSAARLQEAELGPVHPDLTSTLNNLAIVAEKTGRLGDAETFYRRAAAIASASLPADHPTVADSRKNLEDFCRERGLPLEPAVPAAPPLEPAAQAVPLLEPPVQAAAPPLEPPVQEGSRKTQRILPWAAAIGLVAIIAVGLLVTRDSPSREEPTQGATPAPEAAKPTETQSPPVSTTIPAKDPESKTAAPRSGSPAASANAPRAAAAPISLTTVELCKTLSTTGDRWRCDPADNPAARGRIVLYTRVKSPRSTTVVHRWYLGTALQQSVRLGTHASFTDGYRTYSQLTINNPGKWRVEVRSAEGNLLFEKSFAVR